MTPVSSPAEQPSEEMSIAGRPAWLFDLSPSGGERMMVALVPRPDMTWFIKMTGPATALEEQKNNFMSFLSTVRFEARMP
jgi:hypothetical protein